MGTGYSSGGQAKANLFAQKSRKLMRVPAKLKKRATLRKMPKPSMKRIFWSNNCQYKLPRGMHAGEWFKIDEEEDDNKEVLYSCIIIIVNIELWGTKGPYNARHSNQELYYHLHMLSNR